MGVGCLERVDKEGIDAARIPLPSPTSAQPHTSRPTPQLYFFIHLINHARTPPCPTLPTTASCTAFPNIPATPPAPASRYALATRLRKKRLADFGSSDLFLRLDEAARERLASLRLHLESAAAEKLVNDVAELFQSSESQ